MRSASALIAACLLAWVGQAAADTPPPYTLEGTQVHRLPAPGGRAYELFVSLPEGYAQSKEVYPVLFVTDANYAFPLLRSINRRVSDRGANLQGFILIGLSYAVGDTPTVSRNRDYTPTSPSAETRALGDYGGRDYGEAEAWRRWLVEVVFPWVTRNLRADMQHKVYLGHSYGGLFGLHVLLTEPTMFERYLLGSPSLWFDQRVMWSREAAWAKSHADLPARVFMLTGAFEAKRPGVPRYSKDTDMVQDMRDFAALLTSRAYPNLSVQTEVIADEDHLTVFPALATRGLLWAFGRR